MGLIRRVKLGEVERGHGGGMCSGLGWARFDSEGWRGILANKRLRSRLDYRIYLQMCTPHMLLTCGGDRADLADSQVPAALAEASKGHGTKSGSVTLLSAIIQG